MSARTPTSVFVLAIVACLAAACRKDKTDTEASDDPSVLAQDGSEASAVETDNELLTSALVASSATGGSLSLASSGDLGGELAPADVGDGAKLIFFPRGCLAVSHDAATRTVTYQFTECNGPNGLFKISGEVKATYATSPNQLDLDLVGTDLKVNRATVDWSAHARIVAAGMQRTMEWKAQLTGTTARGRDFSRTNDVVVTWRLGERCIALSGTAEGNVKGRDLRTEIADYRRCQGACPEAGGKITITNVATGTKVEISFDGTSQGTVTSPKGTSTFPLACSG